MPLVQIETPGGAKFTVDSAAAPAFQGFLTDLEAQGYKIDPSQSAGYSNRNIAGTNTPSLHASGNAIDVNSVRNPRGANTATDLPPNAGDLAAKWGLTWGGGWSGSTRDPMHFEFHPNVKANTVATTDTNTPFDELMNPKKPPAVAAPAAPEGNTPFDDLIKTPAPPAPVVDPRGTVEDRMVPNPAARTAPPQPPQSMSDRLQEGATQVGLAYTKGADNAPTVLTPGAENVATAVGGVPAWLAIHGANNLLKAGAGGYSALQEGVRQVGNPVGKYLTGQPGLGDDVATALDILPAAKLEGLQAVKGAEIMRRGAFRDQLDKMTTAESTAVENAKTAEGYRKAADDALSSGARDAEIKQKAYQLWQQDGSKPGADPASYWQKAQDSLKGKPGETPKTPVTYMQKSGIDWDKVPKDELPTEKPTDPGTIKTANRIIDIGLAVGGSILGHYHYGYPGGAIGLIAGPFINEVRAKFGAKAADAVGKAIQQQARNPLGTGGEIERMGNPLPDQSAAP